MSIDLQTISRLREMTGAGIGDCKLALTEAGGDLEKAVEILRKKGEIKAAKKAERAASEGVVALAKAGKKVAVIVLTCETDFVARNKDFIQAANDLAAALLNAANPDEFKAQAESKIKNELVVKIGENIQLGEFGVISGEIIGAYLHHNKKVAAIVALNQGQETLANELAMQVAAMSPKYISVQDIPGEVLLKEKEIYREQLKVENKPENIMDKIIEGKLAKFYEEVCLMNQFYIKDDTKQVSDLIKEAGEGIEVKEFKRFWIG